MLPKGGSMTEIEKDNVLAAYESLVYEEHKAGKSIGFDKTDPKNIYLDGYLDALGKALDLLGDALGLGVKLGQEDSAANG